MGRNTLLGKAQGIHDINLDKSIFIDFYKKMFSIRLFEETVLEQFSKNQIPGTVHLYSGQDISQYLR